MNPRETRIAFFRRQSYTNTHTRNRPTNLLATVHLQKLITTIFLK
jgi:hypothetical protein